MLTGMYAVRNMINGENHNLWKINAEQDYHEEIRDEKDEVAERVINRVFPEIFTKLEPLAFGVAVGVVAAVSLMTVTAWVALKDLIVASHRLSLLGQYLPGYEVSIFPGALLGVVYGFILGFASGWLVAFLRNAVMRLYFYNLLWRAEAENYVESSSGN